MSCALIVSCTILCRSFGVPPLLDSPDRSLRTMLGFLQSDRARTRRLEPCAVNDQFRKGEDTEAAAVVPIVGLTEALLKRRFQSVPANNKMHNMLHAYSKKPME
ncbi:hypothetical protein AUEXF2481DRAFT_41108 [Aureobasidium subglaciale EXF-2481]|uniref:Uncharacterized protein n=1 Tax=Aureobasidium subglaciale (strain EXF-2481) TaxID=1043005 RepID=A0A074Z6F8_AURSE|nr:uncharacterized protein AUEXF2481DRAFT_41108 [Aureobasidium subglaciale EXF-2481]KEQ94526.1 hypothetical protein AUEXF2481DRAFT_41108 [Aureobasidium subglaciale EXF-2481]